MSKKLDPKKTVTFKDFLITNAIQIDALCQLLIEKGLITEDEFISQNSSKFRWNIKPGKIIEINL